MKNLSRLTALLLALVMLLSITASATEISNYTKADYDADVVAAKSQTEITAPGVLTAEHNGFSFAVEGEVPETAQLYVTHMGDDTAANIRENILSLPELEEGMSEYAFDITIVNDNAEWQPGTPVEVTINGLDTTSDSFVQVYHIPDSQPAVATLSLMDEDTTPAMTFEEVEATPGEGTVTFMADGFSVYYVVAGSQSDGSGNDTFHILRGTSVQLTGVSNGNYTVTYPAGVTETTSGVNISMSGSTLTFAATSVAQFGTYSIRISSSRTATINIISPAQMFELPTDKKVVFTVIKDSANVPNEPMSGGAYTGWVYVEDKNQNGYDFSGYAIGNTGVYQSTPEGFIDLNSVASSPALSQNLQGQNVIGVIDSGWGKDTLPLINMSEEEWHQLLLDVVDYTTISISDGVGGKTNLSNLSDTALNEKLEDGSYRYKIYPYVVKLILASSDNNRGWHVDCCIVDSKTYSVNYEYNLPETAFLEENFKILMLDRTFYAPNTTDIKVGNMYKGDLKTVLNQSITIRDTVDFSSSEYTFSHWNTKADDSGIRYNPGDTLPALTENVTLYAIWTTDKTSGMLRIEKKEFFEDANDNRINADNTYVFTVDMVEDTVASYPCYIYTGTTISDVVEITDGGELILKAGQYAIINGVPNGAVSVKEVSASINDNALTGYTTSWQVSSSADVVNGDTVTGTVAGNQLSVICTNTYAPLTGTLTVTKTGLSAGESALFTVTVKVGESIYKTFDIALSAEDNDVTFADLPAGAVCTVTESGDWSWRYAETIYDNNDVAIVAGGNVKITVKNSDRTDKWLSDESAIVNFD